MGHVAGEGGGSEAEWGMRCPDGRTPESNHYRKEIKVLMPYPGYPDSQLQIEEDPKAYDYSIRGRQDSTKARFLSL